MNKLLKALIVGGIACNVHYPADVDFPEETIHGDVYVEGDCMPSKGEWYYDADITFYTNYIFIDVDNQYGAKDMYVSNGTKVIVYEDDKNE